MKSCSKSFPPDTQCVHILSFLRVEAGHFSLFSFSVGGPHVDLLVLLFVYLFLLDLSHLPTLMMSVCWFLLRLSLNKFTKCQFSPVHTGRSYGSVESLSINSGLFTGDFLAVL